jgi:Flp pilus assembly protein protease CpaA
MPDYRILIAVFVWLLVCAVQDWRRREVSNWLTLLPLGIIISLRVVGVVQEPLLPVLITGILLLFLWNRGWMGGADIKASLILAALNMQLFAWAWLGLGFWFLGLKIYYARSWGNRLPAFVGYAAGMAAFLVIEMIQ